MHNNELAEKSTIGYLIRDADLIKETKLRLEHYYFDNGKIIFDAIKQVSEGDSKVDAITVCQQLQKMGKLEFVGGASGIVEMERSFWGYDGFEHHERIVIECWKRRQSLSLVHAFRYAIDESQDNNEIDSLIKHLQDVTELGLDVEENNEDRLNNWYNDRVSRSGMSGVTTGYADLDKLTGGYRDECFYILAARPAVGKTALMLCSALKTCANGVITPIFSLEMGMEQLLDRMACALAGIDTYKLEEPNKRFTEEDWKAFNLATAKLAELIKSKHLIIYDKPGITIQEIRAKLRALRRKNKNKKIVAMIDYAQIVRTTTKHRDKRSEVIEISHSLKEIARQCKLPVLALAQLSRGVEQRQDKRPMMSDLKESGDLEADADCIMMLHRPDSAEEHAMELLITKNRHGATGTVGLTFLKQFSRYVSLDRGMR